ncbi:mediator of RNA polymerase II transcription subunit 15-like isoform X2 [Zootermopsis nevadensis]|uniref:mediator of RNA polymerase II transcription subunit 15-like isoform X2 n=1 Tax=Zootermopsis nevadensis TaxID=136037 RepID=UPI000B8E2C74|nr:mediator of RNA polymerase II transcription subunit 15-like isoform X2 [Zootermopsis nevadensis]
MTARSWRSCLSEYSFPHHHTAPHFRRQLSQHEQKEILTDIQQNHRFQQPLVDSRSLSNSHVHPFSILQNSQYSQQQNLHAIPQQPISNPTQHSTYSLQSSPLFSQPQSAIAAQHSPILLSLQQSPLSSPQFSSLFSQQPQTPPELQHSSVPTQSSPVLLSLLNSPLSLHKSKELFLPQSQTQGDIEESQQSPEIFSQKPKSLLSTQQSLLATHESKENQPKLQLTTQEPKTEEHGTDIKVLEGISNTEFTIQRSISDPVELQKVQLLELQREQERKERQKKLQEEQLRLIQEQNERRLKEREEEEKRDEERRLKLQEQLRKVQEEKVKRRKEQEEEQLRLIQERRERLLKQQEEEELRLIQDKERQKKEEEEEKLRQIEERKGSEEKQQVQPLASALHAQATPATKEVPQEIILQPSQNEQRPRQRARVVEESDQSIAPEELFLQNERQKLYYELKKAQEQQEKKQHASDDNQQTQESQQVTRNNERPINHIVRTTPDQGSAQDSKLSQLEKQLHQKQLQEQLQKQFQLQLLQRQDLLRQLKLAVSNTATPTNEDQIVPGPIAISGGNTSSPLFLANGQKIRVVQSPRQGRPLTDNNSRNGHSSTHPVSTTTQRPPRALFEELTKGVLPPGADFEVIRHKQDGALEDVGTQLPQNLPQKKVTFVFLEEQADGSFKVKGVRGNNNGDPEGEQTPAGDVESIIKRIQEGDLKLPAPSSIPVLQQSTVPQLPTSLPSATVSQPYTPHSISNSFPATSEPNKIIKTVSSGPNFQPRPTTAKPNSIIKTVSSNLNFQRHPGMEFLQSVTLPPLYNVDSTTKKDSTVKSQINKQPTQTSFSATHLNSPYSVEAHPTGQDAADSVFPQQTLSSTNSFIKKDQQPIVPSQNVERIIPQYQQKTNSVTPYPTVPQFSPTNKYSPSPVPQFSTSTPKKEYQSLEPFLPTNPSFVNPPQFYSPFFSLGNFPKQTDQKQETAGIIYSNPTTQVPLLTTNTPTRQSVSKHKEITSSDYTDTQRDFQQNVEAPSLKTPTRVAAPSAQNILKEPGRLVPLDEDGSTDYKTKVEAPLSLSDFLKKEGLFAMARFLRESGLNNMLNDTGPYTVFAPTDKAFRTLLVQLGGPEKAEEKFRENPRLLSGLLLHHVIPGAFELSSLQDEMTGVSLAGTQLRVNTYASQDVEWNDVQVVTVNGARISRDKHDIPIPQGVAHAVDRVMFPLPVGNIIQTLRSDRERRFTKFLRAFQSSGLADTFTGNKVLTVFAPTDRAFSVVDSDDLDQLLTVKDMSRALVLRHTIPGTLYTAGMRFYQLRDSMEKGSTIALYKTNGHVKANSASVVTQNIPATNGVIHAIDGLL